MRAKIIFAFLRISITIMYYLMITVCAFSLITAVINIMEGHDDKILNLSATAYTHQVMAFENKGKSAPATYSADSLVRYQNVNDRYELKIQPNSAIGYFTLFMNTLLLAIGITVLWYFKQIFQETNLDNPFRHSIARKLNILAALFIISDLLKFINYFIFNSLLHRSVTSPKFQLITDAGSGLITGLIILIIAAIFQRGIVLQEDNALTV